MSAGSIFKSAWVNCLQVLFLNLPGAIVCRFYVEREELDNLHKSKLQRYYPLGFAVEIEFEPSDDFSGTFSIIESPSDPHNHRLVD